MSIAVVYLRVHLHTSSGDFVALLQAADKSLRRYQDLSVRGFEASRTMSGLGQPPTHAATATRSRLNVRFAGWFRV